MDAILAKFREDMALRNFSDNTRKQSESSWPCLPIMSLYASVTRETSIDVEAAAPSASRVNGSLKTKR